MPGETTAIRVRDLVVGFGSHTVIDHLCLNVRAGEIIGLVGASGGGKSVLMRALIGRCQSGAAISYSRYHPIGAAASCSSKVRCSRR